MFRWYDIDHNSADNGLAIDNVSISYTAAAAPVVTAVPEPSTCGLLATAALAVGVLHHRQRAAGLRDRSRFHRCRGSGSWRAGP